MSAVGTPGAHAATQLLHVRQVLSGPSMMSAMPTRPSMTSRTRETRPRAVSHSTGLTTYVGHVAWQSEHLLHRLAASCRSASRGAAIGAEGRSVRGKRARSLIGAGL